MRKNNKPYTIEYVNEQFNKKDYKLLSKEYKNTNTKLNFVCNKHVDLGVQQVTFASFSTNKCNCSGCKHEAQIINWHNGRNFKPISQDEFYNKNFNKYKEKLFNAVGNEYVLLDVSKKMPSAGILSPASSTTISSIVKNKELITVILPSL